MEIINEPLEIDLYGFEGTAINKDYAGTAFKLSGRMWAIIKAKEVKNKGKNIWVYENNEKVFAGVELRDAPAEEIEFDHKTVSLKKYAYYKHIGPYHLIKQAGLAMRNEIQSKGYETELPYIEIYGHWTGDETTTETELIMSLK